MPMPTVYAVGAVGSSTGAALALAIPAGTVANDIIILLHEMDPALNAAALGAIANYAEVNLSPSSQTTGLPTRLTCRWHRAAGAESGTITVPAVTNHHVAVLIGIRGVTSSGNPWNQSAASIAASSTAVSVDGLTTTIADCLILAAVTTGADTNTGQISGSAWANASLANVTSRVNTWTTSGTGGGIGASTGEKATAGAVNPSTATLLTANTQARFVLALTGAVATPITLADSGQADDELQPAAAVSLLASGSATETLRPAAQTPLAEQGTADDLLSVTSPPVPVSLTDAGTGAEHLCHDGGPAGAPDCILDETNLAGDLTRLWDDPTAPDANWLTALDPTLATDLRVSFPTPATAPGGGGPTVFQTLVRKTGAGPDPAVSVQLWEAGGFVKELATATVTSTSGQLVTATLTPADLSDSSGAQVELRVRTLQPGDDGLYHDSYDAY